MTAPAIVAPTSAPATPAAAPTVVVPVVTPSPSEVFGSALDRIIKTAPLPADDQNEHPTISAGGVAGPPPVEALPMRDAVIAAATGAEVPAVDGVPPVTAPAVPSGEVQSEGGDVVMTAERNADGTFKTQIDPTLKFDIKVRDKETGETKTYTKTIPEVLRMAADGVWGQKVRDEVSYYRTNVPAWQESHATLTKTTEQLQADLQSQMELNRELLTADEALVVQRREEFAREMSPERELARLKAANAKKEADEKAQAEKARQTTEEQRTAKVVQDFATARLAPAVTKAEQLLGSQRAKEMIAYELIPFQVNGKVPPEKLMALEAHLNGPFMQRVQAEAAARSAPDPRIEAAEKARRETEARAQVLANSVGRQISPVTSAANAGSDLTKPVPPPKNVNEAIERIINKPLAATR
jgi:hypothetical protein